MCQLMGPICAIDFMEKGPISWVSYKLDFLESKKICRKIIEK